MTNVIDFPVNDPMGMFVRGIRAKFDAQTWARVEPVVETLMERHGAMPSYNKTMYLSRFKGLSPEECQEIGQLVKQELIEYATLCRGLVLGDLAAALVLNADLREQLDALKK